MNASSTLRRLAATSLVSGVVVGGVLLAAPASAAPTNSTSGISVQTTDYISTKTQSSCESQRRASIALHERQGNLVSYSSKCTYFDWNATWNAQVVYW